MNVQPYQTYSHTGKTICKLLKRAWIQGRISCPCGNAPLSKFDPSQPDIICGCGKRYSWEGCIKGRSLETDLLTAYRVIFEDGTSYSTSMAEAVNLQNAYNYFYGRRIEGKLVVDVDPC